MLISLFLRRFDHARLRRLIEGPDVDAIQQMRLRMRLALRARHDVVRRSVMGAPPVADSQQPYPLLRVSDLLHRARRWICRTQRDTLFLAFAPRPDLPPVVVGHPDGSRIESWQAV